MPRSGLASPTRCRRTSTAMASPPTSRRATATPPMAAIRSPPTCSRRRTRPALPCLRPRRKRCWVAWPPSSRAASSASSGRRAPTSTCASSPPSKRCRAMAGPSRACSARSTSTPNVWPTAAVIDWLNILKRVEGVPDRTRRLDEANQILRGRLVYGGTTLQLQQRGGRLLVVADGQRRRQRRQADPRRARRPGLARRSAEDGRRHAGAPAARRLADDDGQSLGVARARQVRAKFESVALAGKTLAAIDATAPPSPVADWAQTGGWRQRAARLASDRRHAHREAGRHR